MKNTLIFTALLGVAIVFSAKAQYVDDIYRYSNWGVTGTARSQGLGGGYSSIGGDATSAYTNPAGLGFYNRSELSFTPMYNGINTKTTYEGTQVGMSSSNLSIGQAALVLKFEGVGTRRKSSAFAISYSKQAYLPTQFGYLGTNNKSSMQDSFAEKANTYGKTSTDLNNEFDGNTGQASSLSSMAYEAYLIDPTKDGGNVYKRLESSLPTSQIGRFNATGAVSQTNFSYGTNYDDKFYLGFGLGIGHIAYDYDNSHKETFANGKVFNGFGFYDNLSVRGTGINLSVGGIYKISSSIQLGASLISPTWYSMSEDYNAGVTIDVKANTISTNYPSVNLAPAATPFQYNMTTPLRASGGATFFFPNKKGFVSADAEYVGFSGMKVSDTNEADDTYVGWSADQKSAIRNTYKNVVNLKVGAEYRMDVFRVRAGLNYHPDPYKINDGINHSQTAFTLGTGYRNSKYFVDIAGIFGQSNSAYTPYTLVNSQNYASAQIKNSTTSIALSVGTFF